MGNSPTYTDTLFGVRYSELRDSMALNLSGGKARGVRMFHVPWDKRIDFLNVMYGSASWVNGVLKRASDAQRFPGYPVLSVSSVNIEGEGVISNDSGVIEYTHAMITVTYEPEDFAKNETEEEKVLSTESLDFKADFLMIPEGGFKWAQYYFEYIEPVKQKDGNLSGAYWEQKQPFADAGKPIMQQIPKLMPTIQHQYSKRDLKQLPKNILSATIGRVNQQEFPNAKAPDHVPAGQLLFTGASARRTITSRGAKPYEMTIILSERSTPWNFIYNSTVGEFALTTPRIYDQADYKPLLEYTIMDAPTIEGGG